MKQKPEDWIDRLVLLVEKEMDCPKAPKYGCYMNEIIKYIEAEKKKSYEDGLKWMYNALLKNKNNTLKSKSWKKLVWDVKK